MSYLALNNKIPTNQANAYEWAFWGQWEYLQGNSRYQNDPLYSYNGYSLQAQYDAVSYLSPNDVVGKNDY